MKYLFFFKGQPLLLCCVCCKIAIQDFLRGLHEKNKKNLPFHQRIYRQNITRRYFTESCKKITGFCHNHRRIYRRNITRRYFTESCKKITGFCHIHRRIYRRHYRRTTHVWQVSVCSNTDGITDGPHMSDTCPSARIPTAFPTEFPTDLKVWRDFWFFWCEFEFISDGITDGN